MCLACVLVIVGCGGGGQPATPKDPIASPPPPRSECSLAAEHAAGVVLTFKDAPKASKDELAKLFEDHCTADAWAADAIACWKTIAVEPDAKKCVSLLTRDQHDKVFAAFRARSGDSDPAPDIPVEAPPPPSDKAPTPIEDTPRPTPARVTSYNCSPGIPMKNQGCRCPAGYNGRLDGNGTATCQPIRMPANTRAPAKPSAPTKGGPRRGDPDEGGE